MGITVNVVMIAHLVECLEDRDQAPFGGIETSLGTLRSVKRPPSRIYRLSKDRQVSFWVSPNRPRSREATDPCQSPVKASDIAFRLGRATS